MAAERASSPAIRYRLLTTADAIRPVEDLQREVWGFDDVEVVPLHVLLTAARHGGLLLGAYDGTRLVGFSFGYRGVDVDGTPVLCSHLLAVAPTHRGRGVGRDLKWAQRSAAMEHGLPRIVWTFDPLEHGNARLNLDRLGGATNRYVPDLYGELRDELNAGLPTDRLEIVWELASERVARRAPEAGGAAGPTGGDAPVEVEAPGPLLDPDGPGGIVASTSSAPRIRLRALADAQRVRREDTEAARAWRLHLRTTLRAAFADGYLLVGAGRGSHGAEYRLARAATAGLDLPAYPADGRVHGHAAHDV